MPVSTFDWYPAQGGDLHREIANRGKESIRSRSSVVLLICEEKWLVAPAYIHLKFLAVLVEDLVLVELKVVPVFFRQALVDDYEAHDGVSILPHDIHHLCWI